VDADLSDRIGQADERFVPGTADGELIEVEHLARYWWASQAAHGRAVLDAGCGVGYGSAMLAREGASEVVGVDLSDKAVIAAAAGAPANATFLTGDVHALPFEDNRFDLVVCFEVIEHVEEQDAVIAELARVLAPGGILALSSPNRDVYPAGNPHHVHEYVPEELRAALATHFAHVELRRQHDWLASAVLGDVQVAEPLLRELDDVTVGKVFPRGQDSERYTVALASERPLPALPGRVALGGETEPRAWLQELRELRRLVEALTAERDHARDNVADLQAIEAQLRSENDHLLGELEQIRASLRSVHLSLSWRITRPLRALRKLRGRSR
jgi:2-polyprenyl-3-methyl-5-hydroxy-6-metoxy-1,4-benzoquinol methylase